MGCSSCAIIMVNLLLSHLRFKYHNANDHKFGSDIYVPVVWLENSSGDIMFLSNNKLYEFLNEIQKSAFMSIPGHSEKISNRETLH